MCTALVLAHPEPLLAEGLVRAAEPVVLAAHARAYEDEQALLVGQAAAATIIEEASIL